MQKDELIQMHTLLCQIKNHLQDSGVASEEQFDDYSTLRISPVHVHRSKSDHKRAIFMLGKELASFASHSEFSAAAMISGRFGALADDRERPAPRL